MDIHVYNYLRKLTALRYITIQRDSAINEKALISCLLQIVDCILIIHSSNIIIITDNQKCTGH